MKITIITVGKLKEKYWKDAIGEYVKRLGRYCNFQILEVSDEKTMEQPSFQEAEIIKDKEGTRILKALKDDMFVITLEINGIHLSSEEFAYKIQTLQIKGNSHICFIIGGSLGLHQMVLKKSNYSLSFSNMTFPHQLMRVVLVEQIYRCFRIINHEPYHK
jgi:23S rRNA (pseudouridine1915-N3)-methyltransferase